MTYHFAAGHRSGKVWSPESPSAGAALVALGESLVAFAEGPTPDREARLQALERDAHAVAKRF